MEDNYEKERLQDLEEDMNDAYKSWKDAEKEVSDAIEYKNKRAVWYAEAAVAFYNYKKEHGNL